MAPPEELDKQYKNSTQTTTTTTTTTLPKYEAQVDAVNKAYDAANSASLAALENAYNQSKAQTEAAAQKIPATYQAQANSIAAQAERNRQAFNESAGAAGLNVGAGSQAALAQNNQLQSDLTAIRTAEANAKQDLDNQLNQLYTAYQGNIAEALANNEYERANQLLSEYRQAASSAVTVAQNQASLDRQWEQTQYNRAAADAATLAQYGDFSGYAALGYTAEQIAAMRQIWELQNPTLAKAMGKGTGGNPGDYYDPTSPPTAPTGDPPTAPTAPTANLPTELTFTDPAEAPDLRFKNSDPLDYIPLTDMDEYLNEMRIDGESKTAIMRELIDAKNEGNIREEDYQTLQKMYDNTTYYADRRG